MSTGWTSSACLEMDKSKSSCFGIEFPAITIYLNTFMISLKLGIMLTTHLCGPESENSPLEASG